MKKVIFSTALIIQAAMLTHSSWTFAAPGNGNGNGPGNGNAYDYDGQGNGNHFGFSTAPVPLAGAGLPALALIGGGYVALRAARKRRERNSREG